MIRTYMPGEFNPERPTRGASPPAVVSTVAEIIADVAKRGDAAVREYTQKFDGCSPGSFEVSDEEMTSAMNAVDAEFMETMTRAAANIEAYHSRQIRHGFVMTPGDGIVLGQRIMPIARVGIYVPGGTAPYPSSVLMNCIPAKIAGVSELILATPPSKDGSVDAGILAAATIAGVGKVLKIGGAQAIAAMAYGTETIPRVDKITGPGNAYVAEAKRQVFGIVGIDMIAGPSDILVIADEHANPEFVAADMLSQCEHGEDSIAVLITDSKTLASKVCSEIEDQLPKLPREVIARASIDSHGKIIIVDSMEQAFDISNELAPEHLEVYLAEPFAYLDKVKNAGSVFLGRNTPEAVGDYYSGTNHTIPTSGAAWFASPLSVDDFIKKSSFTYYTEDALCMSGADIVRFAEKESFAAHAAAVSRRLARR